MENSNGSCEIVYKTQTHEFSTDASQLLVLVKIFFWQGGGVGHTKKKKFCGMWGLKLLDQGSNLSSAASEAQNLNHWTTREVPDGQDLNSLQPISN